MCEDLYPVGTFIYWPSGRRVPIGWEPACEEEPDNPPPGFRVLVPIVKIFNARPKKN